MRQCLSGKCCHAAAAIKLLSTKMCSISSLQISAVEASGSSVEAHLPELGPGGHHQKISDRQPKQHYHEANHRVNLSAWGIDFRSSQGWWAWAGIVFKGWLVYFDQHQLSYHLWDVQFERRKKGTLAMSHKELFSDKVVMGVEGVRSKCWYYAETKVHTYDKEG